MLGLIRLIFKTLAYSGQQQPRAPRARSLEPEPNNRAYGVKRQALTTAEMLPLIEGLPEAKVLNILDGDTLIVARSWRVIKIRLDSIDCPEDGQEWGDIAMYGLIKLIGGRTVKLETHGIDSYGRTLATLYVRQDQGWLNVNERMVTLGHAWVMRAFYDHLPHDRQTRFNRLETWAKSKRVGLWNSENPIPPWQWRKSVDNPVDEATYRGDPGD